MTVSQSLCASCGTNLRESAKFCDECGMPAARPAPAEYKQVTVLFADVVHSMDIAAAVGSERLRELMAELVSRCADVVKRYGGTVDKFTGDGVMALFGAPTTLEDHAFRACMAALEIQQGMLGLADAFQQSDGISVQLRIGLNSGEVIAGEIGSGLKAYTAIGEQVGMAQRMESAAPAGGVMLSESTARLVENTAVLGEPELVHVKGIQAPVAARRLLAIESRRHLRRSESALVGRSWELSTLSAILDEAIGGTGCVVNIVGPPGIGKSRIVRELVAVAAQRGVEAFAAYGESHARDVPFYVVARLLRAAFGIDDLAAPAARARVRELVPEADPEDLQLFDDLLGIRDPAAAVPEIAADARDRRLTALVNAASLAREEPAVYVVEDVHWIDEVSEAMMAAFLTVIAQTSSLVLLTYRPEYHGVLARVSGAQALALRPLSDAQTAAMATELLGNDPSIRAMADLTAARAAGNPFFAEEIVRDLIERGVVRKDAGAYVSARGVSEESVPATLQATIGARIDRLAPGVKHTLHAAAVVGLRFDAESLSSLADDPDVKPLLEAELVDQVKFMPHAEYAFRHPLIRAVAYESQLRSERANLHRRLAASIESRDPASVDENAALIAEHLEAAGDLHAAFAWHMRAGGWLTNRSINAAHSSWQKARQVADRLPDDDPNRTAMRIAPRTLLCGSAWRAEGSGADLGFEELRELCGAAGDKRSLAIGMAGAVVVLYTRAQRREASQLASEFEQLLDAVGDPTLTLALAFQALAAKLETAEMHDVISLAGKAIEAAEGDPTRGDLIVASPLSATLAMRSTALWSLGRSGWRDDVRTANDMVRGFDPTSQAGTTYFTNGLAVPHGIWLPDSSIVRETGEIHEFAQRLGDDLALDMARTAHGVALLHCSDPDWRRGVELLTLVRDEVMHNRYSFTALPLIDSEIARAETHLGRFDEAVERSQAVADDLLDSRDSFFAALACSTLVEALLSRHAEGDLAHAQAVVDRLAVLPTDPGFVVNDVTVARLRALLARARADDDCHELAGRYRDMAESLGFEGHIAMAQAM